MSPTPRPRPRLVPRLGPQGRPDAGTSVVEMSVTLVVAALLLAAVAAVFTGGLRTVRSVDVSTSSVADARRAIEAVSRTLRVAFRPPSAASAVVAATPTSLSFWALLNRSGAPSETEPVPTLVEYRYDGHCLVQTQTQSGAASTTCLVRTSAAPGFTYYPSGALGTDGSTAAPLPATPSVATEDLGRVQSIGVSLVVHDPDHPESSGVPVTVQVTLENVVAAAGG